MIRKPLAHITPDDLEELINGGRPEGRQIDYKMELPGGSDDEKRELAKDVSAIANTLGGDIVYGVREKVENGQKTGLPEEFVGLDVASRDSEQLRIESIIRTAVDPRIPGVEMRWIPHPREERPSLVIRVPRSLLSPHMVTYRGLNRFFGRGVSGTNLLDVREIRAAFDSSGDVAKKLQAFRADRLMRIQSRDTPAPLTGRSRMVLHVVPLSSFEVGANVDLSIRPLAESLLYRDVGPETWRYNVEGYVGSRADMGYVQYFRNGSLEAVDTGLINSGDDRKSLLPSLSIEESIIISTGYFVRTLEKIGARAPFLIGLSLLDVKGVGWGVSKQTMNEMFGQRLEFDRDVVVLPEAIVESSDGLWSQHLRLVIDSLWQAVGRPGSESYDESGNWKRGGGKY